MASITFRKSTKYGTEPYAILTVSAGSQDTDNNRTLVSYSLTLYRPRNVSSSVNKTYSISLNGATVASGTYAIGGKGTKIIKSGSVWIKHNSDGTKKLSFGGVVKFGVTWSGTRIDKIQNSSSMNLTTIILTPPGSTLNVPTSAKYYADGSTEYKITCIPYADDVIDTAVLTVGDYSKSIIPGENFTIPIEWCNAIPINTDHTTGIITLTTTQNDKVIGTSTAEIEIYMPEALGRPGKPEAEITSQHKINTFIELKKPEFKYGAFFSRWEISCNKGSYEMTDVDNIVHTREEERPKTTIVMYVRAIDSRGFASKMLTIPCFIDRRGLWIYDKSWKPVVPYVYINGKYEKYSGAVYADGKWKKVYVR